MSLCNPFILTLFDMQLPNLAWLPNTGRSSCPQVWPSNLHLQACNPREVTY